jgi:hypothetical protein
LREQSDKTTHRHGQDLAAKVGVSKTTLINFEWDLKEEIDNLKAAELDALSDQFYLSTRERVKSLCDVLSRIQPELETLDLSSTQQNNCSQPARTSVEIRSVNDIGSMCPLCPED